MTHHSSSLATGLLASGFSLLLLSGPGRAAPGGGNGGIMARPAPPANDQEALVIPQSPFVAVARRVVPAVVYVDADRRGPDATVPSDRVPPDLYHRLFPNDAPGDMNLPGSGSGFIIDAEGYILTNNHVVAGADNITVHLSDGRTYRGEIIGTDDKTDVAVLRIRPLPGDPPFPVVRLGDSEAVEVGEWAVAIGNPLGELAGSVTVGVISAKGRANLDILGGGPDYQDFLQTDASINFGNSGGPLVNARGEVIGINTAINPTGQGLGFAIPINMARNVSVQLIANGRVTRAYMGVVPQELTSELADGLGIAIGRGILVAHVESGGPAEKAGLRTKDIITEIDGQPVEEVNRFRRFVAEAPVGHLALLTVFRDGQVVTRQVELGPRPDDRPEAQTGTPSTVPLPTEWLGARIEPMTREMADGWQVGFEPGLAVTGVEPGSPAEEAGLGEGDIVREVNDRAVLTIDDWRQAILAARGRTRPLVLLVSRGGVVSYLAIRVVGR
ncbi:MAG: trypsin-like peptidase domain-containing protein [Candidatus Eisenbacteria bacterium]|nr:trypsin-like peptidase domain-containing protein [Candidatus Eisenbacteria bacterium]